MTASLIILRSSSFLYVTVPAGARLVIPFSMCSACLSSSLAVYFDSSLGILSSLYGLIPYTAAYNGG